jgi:hypothetical protein
MGDELLHVPLIVKPPLGAQLARGKRVGAQVRTHDLMPTLLELAGLHTSTLDIDAESLLPYIATRSAALADHRVAISENIKHDVLTIRDLGFKYVMHHPPGRVVNEQLYDLRKDPAEHTDVAAYNPAVVRDMRLKALAHLMQNRHGRYLVVLGDGKERSYRVHVHSAEPIRGAHSLHGLKMRTPSGDSELSFAGVSAAEVVLVARFDAPEDTQLDIELTSSGSSALKIHKRAGPEAFVRFQEGVFDRLIRDGQLDLHLFTGPPPATRTEPHTLSAQRLETLHTLGYVR